MKIVRFSEGGRDSFGELRGERIFPLEGSIDALRRVAGTESLARSAVKLLAPTVPSKIIACGPGYLATLEGAPPPALPQLWLKPSTAVLDPEGEIELPPGTPVYHEAEVALVIGHKARNVSVKDAIGHVLGYTICHDVTAGDLSDREKYVRSQLFVYGKTFDTFAPLGPVIVTDLDTTDLRIQCRINGEIRQDHRTTDRFLPYDELVSMISRIMTLLPGDVITTGSIPGMGLLKAGDVVELEIDGIGILRNRVVASKT